MAAWVVRAGPRWLRTSRHQTTLGQGAGAGAITSGTRQALRCSAPFPRANASSQAKPRASRNLKPAPATPKAEPGKRNPALQTSPPPSQNSQGTAPIDAIFQQRKLPLVGAGFAALCLGLYVSLLVSSYMKSPAPSCTCEHPSTAGADGEPLPPTGRPPAVDAAMPGRERARQSASAFDKGLDVPEWLMGITGLRKRLAAGARGHVLEVAVGTGRNLAYYDWAEVVAATEEPALQGTEKPKSSPASPEGGVLSFTGVDISADMMSVARTRIRDAVPVLKKLMRRRRVEPMPEAGGTVVDILDSRIRLCISDAEQALPAPPVVNAGKTGAKPASKYDTVLQTFGLCSVSDPAKLLSKMASMVQPGSGRIVLLEHGRGWYDWVNGLLDEYADPHFKRYGCWWNRDIENIVRKAAQKVPGLEVVNIERPLFMQMGTTLVIELRVKSTGEEDATITGTPNTAP
ncbi:hypothetical protein QBC33DRAFT_536809 [Phialemonium atrogriseum]|uniref:Methyltransferase type 11 domain-containing protein n=1 Tax=Phialemonium atrogriseum TaxID=1093897 RepID=A0AAJ0BZZ1_9PEZI|nr:uncharacterized protein QBC33DRAFT_536809 [Phialemonium atrogriseum]KAK1767633.1 hypothetical protein QBC33DRAFT_536809 [Phialemonium atrogriseum]